MFCSDMQLEGYRPNQYCDLLALVVVAFYLVNKDVPCTKYADEEMNKTPSVDLFASEEFVKFRKLHKDRFVAEFCSSLNPFNKLYSLLVEKLDFYQNQMKKVEQNPHINFQIKHTIDYEHLISQIKPEQSRSHSSDEQLHRKPKRQSDSNISDLVKKLSKSANIIEGVKVPKHTIFDAKQCLLDLKRSQLNGKNLSKISDHFLQQRSNQSSDQPPRHDSMHNIKFGSSQNASSAKDQESILEYFSPVYLATLVLKQGINPV